MRPHLAAVAARQGGLVLRRQAKAAGYSERELRTLTAVGGQWVIVRRGVYVERALWEALDDLGRWRLRDRAGHLAMTQPHVLSHDSAARALDLPLLKPRLELVHVTRPGVGGSRTEHGIKHHLATRFPDVEVALDLPVTGLARTAVDLGREHGFSTGLVAADAAARRGVSALDFERELTVQRSWPGITSAREAVALSDSGAESPLESLARALVIELGIGEPETQFPVRAEGHLYWVDIRVGCHLFECDGKLKFISENQGGVATKPATEVVWDERKRQRSICAEGLGMSRIVWDDVFGTAARQRALKRLRAEYEVTLQRYGDVLPEHLARAARELRGRRRA